MTGIDGLTGRASRPTHVWLAVGTVILLAFSVMAAAAPVGAGETTPEDIPGRCDPGYTKIADDYSGGLSWTADADYSSVVLVGGPNDPDQNKDPQGRNATFVGVEAGDTISRTAHDISHICAIAAMDVPSVRVVKDVRGDAGAQTTAFAIVVGTPDSSVTMTFEDGSSHTFSPPAGTVRFGVAERALDERGWTTSIECTSDERASFGTEGSSLVIDEIGDGEDIVCTVINSYDDGETPSDNPSTTPTQPQVIEPPCFDGTAQDEDGRCVAPEPAADEVVVLGVQIEATTTTIEAVTIGTLPFTGGSPGSLVAVGLSVLVLGALALGASSLDSTVFRAGRHASSSRPFRGWVNS